MSACLQLCLMFRISYNLYALTKKIKATHAGRFVVTTPTLCFNRFFFEIFNPLRRSVRSSPSCGDGSKVLAFEWVHVIGSIRWQWCCRWKPVSPVKLFIVLKWSILVVCCFWFCIDLWFVSIFDPWTPHLFGDFCQEYCNGGLGRTALWRIFFFFPRFFFWQVVELQSHICLGLSFWVMFGRFWTRVHRCRPSNQNPRPLWHIISYYNQVYINRSVAKEKPSYKSQKPF